MSFTWAKGAGGWRVRGDAGASGRAVEVTRRDGTTSTVTLGEVVDSIDGATYYATGGGSSTTTSARTPRRGGCDCDCDDCSGRCRCDRDCNCRGGNIYGC